MTKCGMYSVTNGKFVCHLQADLKNNNKKYPNRGSGWNYWDDLLPGCEPLTHLVLFWYFNWRTPFAYKKDSIALGKPGKVLSRRTLCGDPCRALLEPLGPDQASLVLGSFLMRTITLQKTALLFFVINNYSQFSGALQHTCWNTSITIQALKIQWI